MTEVIDGYRRKTYTLLILECGHWYKWTGLLPPSIGTEFTCPSCTDIGVERPSPCELPECRVHRG